MSRITKVKIRKIDGIFRVECHRSGTNRTVYDCKNCSKFIEIDPVKAEITCRED